MPQLRHGGPHVKSPSRPLGLHALHHRGRDVFLSGQLQQGRQQLNGLRQGRPPVDTGSVACETTPGVLKMTTTMMTTDNQERTRRLDLRYIYAVDSPGVRPLRVYYQLLPELDQSPVAACCVSRGIHQFLILPKRVCSLLFLFRASFFGHVVRPLWKLVKVVIY